MIFLLLVSAPLALGVLIYLAFDGCSGWPWLESLIGSLPICSQIPTVTEFTLIDVSWIRFYVPDFLWAFSFAACFTYFDERRSYLDRIVMYGVAISPEIGQSLGWLPGTADTSDLILILLASWAGNRCMERSPQ